MDHSLTEYALLAAQSALLDVVDDSLRAVDVQTDTARKIFYIRFYYDGASSEEQIEDWNCAISEATASLTLGTDEKIERIDHPQQIPVHGRLAYLRKEPYISLNRSTINESSIITRELINFDNPVGTYISPRDLQFFPTSWAVIHSAEQKSHMIPARPFFYEPDIQPETYALLALQRALLGRVTPELRCVITEVITGSTHLFIRFYYEKPVPIEILDEWECALSEVMADFGQGYTFDMAIELLPYPHKIPFKGRYAYLKKGGQIWDT